MNSSHFHAYYYDLKDLLWDIPGWTVRPELIAIPSEGWFDFRIMWSRPVDRSDEQGEEWLEIHADPPSSGTTPRIFILGPDFRLYVEGPPSEVAQVVRWVAEK